MTAKNLKIVNVVYLILTQHALRVVYKTFCVLRDTSVGGEEQREVGRKPVVGEDRELQLQLQLPDGRVNLSLYSRRTLCT